MSTDNSNHIYLPIERNDLCYCGSNKKYKRCHLAENANHGKVAVKYPSSNGEEKYDLMPRRTFNIKMKNTFSEIDIGLMADYSDSGFDGGDGE